MDITAAIPQGQPQIDAYGDGGFRISGQHYQQDLLVQASGVTPWDGAFRVHLLDASVEILLFGFGHSPRRLPRDFAAELKARGIGHDSMDSGAACRTYNVLAAEGRRVAALLCRV